MLGVRAGCGSALRACVVMFVGIAGAGATAATAAETSIPIPQTILECEIDRCTGPNSIYAVWSFDGRKGMFKFPNGAAGTLEVARFDAEGVLILRVDAPGSLSAGIQAQYIGKIQGDHIDGTIIWSRNGEVFRSSWHAQMVTPTQTREQALAALTKDSTPAPRALAAANALDREQLPQTLLICSGVCLQGAASECQDFRENSCATLVRERDVYELSWYDTRALVTVERWQGGHIKLKSTADAFRRDDPAEYVAQFNPDGSVYGTLTEHDSGHSPYGPVTPTTREIPIKMRPLSKASEKSAPCDASAETPISLNDYQKNLALAWQNGDLTAATCWDQIAANNNVPEAYDQRAYDLLYGTGGVPENRAQARVWAQKAAERGDDDTLGLMIASGWL
jgi:hypothetical protein